MPDLLTRQGVRQIIDAYGLKTKKKLGQNFLVDKHVSEKILKAANVGKADCVLEIGPGIGGLTQVLLPAAGFLVAVELDKTFAKMLSEIFSSPHLSIIQEDILRVKLKEALPEWDGPIKVVANLPYYITTPVIFHLFESGVDFESITVMVQKEVAHRMAASPGTKDYGALTLAVSFHADAEIVANVPVNSFMPRPGVDSAVVKLKLLEKPRVMANKVNLFKVIHAAFGKRRKTLLNALDSESLGGEGGKSRLTSILTQCGIDPKSRGETLDIFQFSEISERLFDL